MESSQKKKNQKPKFDIIQSLQANLPSCENLISPIVQDNNIQFAHKLLTFLEDQDKGQFFKELFKKFMVKYYNNSKQLWQINTTINIYYDGKESSSPIQKFQTQQKYPQNIFIESINEGLEHSNLERLNKVILPKRVIKSFHEQKPKVIQYTDDKQNLLSHLELKLCQIIGKVQKKKQDNTYLTNQIQQYWKMELKKGFPIFKTQRLIQEDKKLYIVERVFFKQLTN